MRELTIRGRFGVAFAALALLMVAGAASARTESTPGYLGVMLQDISPSMANALKLEGNAGVLISDVVDGSPAEEAGLEDGDVILEFNGKTIEDAGDLTAAVRGTEPGDKAKLLVLRDGEREKIKVEIGENDTDENIEMEYEFPHMPQWHDEHFGPIHLRDMLNFEGQDRGYLGIQYSDLSTQLGEYFGVENGDGVLITEVMEDSPAAAGKLQAGDVLIKIDKHDISSTADLMHTMGKTEPGDKVTLTIVRKGKEKSVAVTLAEMPENTFIHRGLRTKPRVKFLRQEIEPQELDQLREELDQLRSELDQLRQEFDRRK